MKRNLILAGLLLSWVIAAPAGAQSVKKTVSLLPGGQTIGGPGAVKKLAPGASVQLLVGGSSLQAGVTIVNTGKSGGQIEMQAPAFLATDVQAGRTKTLCRADVDTIEFRCFGSSTAACGLVWRVDKF